MPTPISIFINKIKDFDEVQFEEFVSGFKKKHVNIKTMQSKEDKYIYGYYPGDKEAQFRWNPNDKVLETDLKLSDVLRYARNS